MLSLMMARMPEPAQLSTQTKARKQTLDRSSSTPAEDEARTNLLGFLTQPLPINLLFWMSVFTSERGPKLLRRGLVPGLMYTCLFLSSIVMVDLLLSLRSIWARVALFVSVAALMAPLRMIWTHSVVTGERTRMLDYRSAVNRSQHAILVVPSLLHSFSCCVLLLVPGFIAWSCEWRSLKLDLASMVSVLAIPTTALLIGLCLFVPSSIALTRVETALLDDGSRVLVPFDCEKIIPRYEHHQGYCSSWFAPYARAVKSIDIETIWRLYVQHLRWTGVLFIAHCLHSW